MLYHAVIGKSNNDDAILGFEGYHSRKKLVRMYKEYIREEFDDENFFNLLGDILVDIIDRQENLNIGYTNDRENNSQ